MNGTDTARKRGRWLSPGTLKTCCALLLVAGALVRPASASELTVKPAAAIEGSRGLEVTTGIGCGIGDLLVAAGPIVSDLSACATITTDTPGPVTVDLAGVDLLAGTQIRFNSVFTVEADLFTAKINPFIATPFAYVTDGSPNAQRDYVAWFSINLDPLSLALNEDLGVFVGYNAAGTEQLRVLIRRFLAAPEVRLVIQGRDNTVGGLVEHPEQFPLTAGFNRVSVWWRALADRGQLLVSVNREPLTGIEDLDNATSKIDTVRLGLVDGNPSSTTGSFYLDDFSSFRTLAP